MGCFDEDIKDSSRTCQAFNVYEMTSIFRVSLE